MADRGRRLRQLTWEGNNEDPSWAPDGRHLVFVGQRDWGTGLMVVDTATGTYRMLRRGLDVLMVDERFRRLLELTAGKGDAFRVVLFQRR